MIPVGCAAFDSRLDPEALWRASCGAQSDDQREWLHEMAVELIDLQELPETPYEAPLRIPVSHPPVTLRVPVRDDDIPF